MRGESWGTIDYRRLARRNLESLLHYKFLHEYGYDKGSVVARAIVADICATVRSYYTRAEDLEPGQIIYPAPLASERGGRGKTMAKTKLMPIRLTIVAPEDVEAIRTGAAAAARREVKVRRLTTEAHKQGALLSCADIALLAGYSTSAVSMTARSRITIRRSGSTTSTSAPSSAVRSRLKCASNTTPPSPTTTR